MIDGNCFSKKYRLLNSQDFNYLKQNSLRFNHPFFRVYYKKSLKSEYYSRVGISISKKVCKAHLRNRLKRVFREFFRNSDLKNTGHDYFLVVSPFLFKKLNRTDGDFEFSKGLKKLESYLLKKPFFERQK